MFKVDALDFIDETPIVDIKRYSPSWDCVFSARSSRDQYLLDKSDPTWPGEMETEAARFHGEHCLGVVAGVRLVQFVALNWNIMPKDADLHVAVPTDPRWLHIADAVQALDRRNARHGRLTIDPNGTFVFRYREREIVAEPLDLNGHVRHGPAHAAALLALRDQPELVVGLLLEEPARQPRQVVNDPTVVVRVEDAGQHVHQLRIVQRERLRFTVQHVGQPAAIQTVLAFLLGEHTEHDRGSHS